MASTHTCQQGNSGVISLWLSAIAKIGNLQHEAEKPREFYALDVRQRGAFVRLYDLGQVWDKSITDKR